MTKFKQWLATSGLKKTKHRLLVLDILDKHHDFLTADDIFIKAKTQDDSISLSTVYRILEQFIKNDLVTPITVDFSKQVLYELKHEKHTHHLICMGCKKVIHVEGCPIHDYQKTLAKKYKFKVAEHKLDFYGYCEACANEMNAS